MRKEEKESFNDFVTVGLNHVMPHIDRYEYIKKRKYKSVRKGVQP